MPESANIARHLARMAALQPRTAALKIPRRRTASGAVDYLTLSFHELDVEVNAWVSVLQARGVQPGDRVLVMVRPGLPLIASAFALFCCGAVPIIIDPGMGLKSFLSCVERSRPRVLLGIPFARLISRIYRKPFSTIAIRVPVRGSRLARRTRPAKPIIDPDAELTGPQTQPIFRESTDLAAILFTSGSTGLPKGVCYEHGMFEAQVRSISRTYEIEPGEIDLPMLPIFALFNPALGLTTIVPDLDPSRPASFDPAAIVQAIQQERVTSSFGSPTLWNKIADHCIQKGITLPTLKRVLCAGAAVPASLWSKSRRFLPNGELHSPYGATEALPISSISASAMTMATEATAGALTPSAVGAPIVQEGTCLGRPLFDVRVKIIALRDGPIGSLLDARELRVNEIGEIIVNGLVVTKNYDGLPGDTALAKIKNAETFWHRMGDCGYVDREGRLWFCGRKAERVETPTETLFTEPCENVFRGETGVARCALIGLGQRPQQIPALVVEPERPLSSSEKKQLVERLRERGRDHRTTHLITRFYFHPNFPVDVRHNAKIHRLALAKWAVGQTPIELV